MPPGSVLTGEVAGLPAQPHKLGYDGSIPSPGTLVVKQTPEGGTPGHICEIFHYQFPGPDLDVGFPRLAKGR